MPAWSEKALPLFAPRGIGLPESVNAFLRERHYLGETPRGFAYHDQFGVMVLSNPSSRRLPQGRWLELSRWCIDRNGVKDAGSKQWGRAARELAQFLPDATTIVSYSDPSVGHTGALYRACNWLWAPTWHRLRPPPTGNGSWADGESASSVKDRWVFPLRRDPDRAALLSISDAGVRAQFPWAEYLEPRWRGRRWRGGGGDYKRWLTSGQPRAAPSDPFTAQAPSNSVGRRSDPEEAV